MAWKGNAAFLDKDRLQTDTLPCCKGLISPKEQSTADRQQSNHQHHTAEEFTLCTVHSVCRWNRKKKNKIGSFFSSFASFQLLFRLCKAERHSDPSGLEPLICLQNLFRDSTWFTLLLHKAGHLIPSFSAETQEIPFLRGAAHPGAVRQVTPIIL